MSFLDRQMNDEVVLIRDGREILATVYVQGGEVFAPFDIDAEVGDFFRFSGFRAEQVVQKVDRVRAPGGRLAHAVLHLVTVREWAERRAASGPQSVTQNIGTAMHVAGHDISGNASINIHVNVSMAQLLDVVRQAVEESPAIPDTEKQTLRSRIIDLAKKSVRPGAPNRSYPGNYQADFWWTVIPTPADLLAALESHRERGKVPFARADLSAFAETIGPIDGPADIGLLAQEFLHSQLFGLVDGVTIPVSAGED